MKGESVAPPVRRKVLLLGDASARPSGLERELTRAGFQLLEREDPAVDPEADAVLITLNDIPEGPLPDILPGPADGPKMPPPRIVLLTATGRDGPAAALTLGAADALEGPVHFPELCARLNARIRDREELARPQQEPLRDAARAFIQPGLHPDDLVVTLVRRLARAFDLAHCSFVAIAANGDRGRIVAAVERPAMDGEELELSRHPEIAEAVRTRQAVIQQPGPAAETGRAVIVLPVEAGERVAAALLLRPRVQRRLTLPQLEFAAGLARHVVAAFETGDPQALNGRGRAHGQADLSDPGAAVQALDRRVREEFERARRYALSFSVILLAVDELRGVRERLGEEAADRLRRDISTVLRRELRLPDFVVTYGNNEFAMVLPETGQTGARQSVLRVRERLAVVPSKEDPRLDRPRFSAGIVTYPHPAVSQTDELYALAEAALMRGRVQAGERIGVAM